MLELNKIYYIDALEGIEKLDDNSIDVIITSPPYYVGKDYEDKYKTVNGYKSYITNLIEVFTK